MDYVIFDLEWNQCPYGKGKENPKLPFEIIEIGAVKMDGERNVVGTFHRIVKPVVYQHLHHRTREVVGLTEEDLQNGIPFAQAVQETLMEEAVQTAIVGIGEEKHTLAQLGESYAEAKRAMEVGSIFHSGESIHMFRRLMLERFLMNVPREESMLYHSLLFNRKTAKLFNEEMLQTIEMFFRKDLNLSDTARQLFIHRNTLVYRLDKVQRQTGLDLRHFDDAVTFKILYELKKCGQEKPRQIY